MLPQRRGDTEKSLCSHCLRGYSFNHSVEQRQRLDRRVAERHGAQQTLLRLGAPALVVGVNRKQRLTRFNSIADLDADFDADGVIDRVAFLFAARPPSAAAVRPISNASTRAR